MFMAADVYRALCDLIDASDMCHKTVFVEARWNNMLFSVLFHLYSGNRYTVKAHSTA